MGTDNTFHTVVWKTFDFYFSGPNLIQLLFPISHFHPNLEKYDFYSNFHKVSKKIMVEANFYI